MKKGSFVFYFFCHVIVLTLLISYCSYTVAIAAEIHVNEGQSIQSAINSAITGDVIIVEPGTYVEYISFLGKAITVKGIDPNDMNVVAATIIDAKQVSSVVTFSNGEGNDSVLNGITIQNGNASKGGGIFCKNSNPTIKNCIITSNSASYGGGIYCTSSSSPTITNCTITNNSTSGNGGGIFCTYSSSPTITNCMINDNSSSYYCGGGISCSYSNPTITNCVITGNSAKNGGGIYCTSSSPTITNCTITNNSASNSSGGIYCTSSSPAITNCTIIGNSASYGGGIYCISDSSPLITNCIVWNNSPDEICIRTDYNPIVTYSDIQGGFLGVGNIDVDPLFIDPNAGDFHLSRYSPCLDSGDPYSLVFVDKDGRTRPQDGNGDNVAIYDIGAYEQIYTCPHEAEVCDGIDNNCDGLIDEGFDLDGDGFTTCGGDCNESDININPSVIEIDNGIDDDCDGAIDEGFHAKIHVPEQISSIQKAIWAAETGDEIIIHPGTYYENIVFCGKSMTLRSMDPNDPDTIASTIIDGDSSGNVIIFINGEDTNTILSGLTIRNGRTVEGGGIYCTSSSPTITNCTITGNSASWDGGGIYCHRSNPSITNCSIIGNSASRNGSGICCDLSSPSITNSTIIGNSASRNGGGINCDVSKPSITNCTITGNSASSSGGGINCNRSKPSITNCTITGNSASSSGGGINCNRSNPSITNCSITGNSASWDGGGIYCGESSTNTSINNCILWDNSPDEIYVREDGTLSNVTYSNIMLPSGVYRGEGNINSDPLFFAPDFGIFYLKKGSNCIDTGISDNAPTEDKAGIPRPQGSRVDIGAYEYIDANSCIPRALFSVNRSKGFNPLTVKFDASPSGASQYYDTEFLWDFGDGNSILIYNDSNVTHTYRSYGTYDVSLVISTSCGSHRLIMSDLIKVRSPTPTKDVGKGYPYITVQSAIDDADDYGELILVHDGIYVENIDFKGKRIGIYSENGAASTIIDGGKNGAVITFNHMENEDTILDGFTIKNGSGSGIYCILSSPTITNCMIIENSASDDRGGGVYCKSSNPTIINCSITCNYAVYGGGIYCRNSNPAITNCIIDKNSANSGAGIYCLYSSPTITKCIITKNLTPAQRHTYGAGMYCFDSSPTITNCIISENSALSTDESYGGGIYSRESSLFITNCTVSGNSVFNGGNGGGIFCRDPLSTTITNCIFWDNKPDELYGLGDTSQVTYSNIKQYSIYPGEGNIYSDPLFINKEQGNYYLLSGSPCIDTGTSQNAPLHDQTGIPRPQDIGIDIGAYEYVDPNSCTPRASFTVNVTKGIDILNVEFDASSSGGGLCASGTDFLWDFGDGNSATDINPSYKYTSYGQHSVKLKITTSSGSHSLVSRNLIKIKSSEVTKEVGEGYNYNSIQNAINDATYGEFIIVHDGIYYENINFFRGKEITLSSEQGCDNTIIDGGGDGSVITFDNLKGTEIVLDGFTIKNGKTNDKNGINCIFSNPIIKNCNFIYANISFDSSDPTLKNCTISGNSKCAIDCWDSNPTITNCTITRNSTGIRCVYFSRLTITNCNISKNLGSGISCEYFSYATITNCIIGENNGGGINCWYYSSPTVTNCTIIGNSGGDGIHSYKSFPKVSNCILWDNMPFELFETSQITYSNIKQDDPHAIYSGVGNINSEPLFVNKDQGNYYLLPDSPCIDKGTSVSAPLEDKEGISRPQGIGFDMGAYEYVNPTSCIPRASFTADVTEGFDTLMVEFDASSSGGSLCASGADFLWDFGDGNSATGMNISHKYATYGSYSVRLTITTSYGSHSLLLQDLIKIRASEPTKDVGSGYGYETIQEAIDDAVYGEIILVHDGIYYENINFKGKAVTVRSENGAESTIIDGNRNGSVITFNIFEGIDSVLNGFTIRNGKATRGGGIYCELSSPTIINCNISENSASDGGGGIYCSDGSGPIIINCIINKNLTSSSGGGINSWYNALTPTIINCTISGNSASSHGGGIFCNESSLLITNSICWDNMPDELYDFKEASQITYSNIKQDDPYIIYSGLGNINSEPLFVNKDQGNYYLLPDSPCIDKGTSASAPLEDKEGISRPQGIGFDMGAYEYVNSASYIPRASFSADVTEDFDTLLVEFDASSSGGGLCASGADFLWDFGDGNSATGMNISHKYATYGSYSVRLTITTSYGSHSLLLQDLIKIRASEPTKEVGSGYEYETIQEAIDDAVYGEIVLVHDGIYYENITFKGKAITVRSENGAGSTIIDGNRNGSVITFNFFEGIDSVLNGFTIRNGKATRGGGIYCDFSSPSITNCTITGNSASSSGGGIYCSYSSGPIIRNCTVTKNLTSSSGGGICCLSYSSPSITNCTINDNSASDDGGGIYCTSYSSPDITNCTINDNLASNDGGGIYCRFSNPTITNCALNRNSASNDGGGICCYSSSTIKNCMISGNSASYHGGGIAFFSSGSVIINCTIGGNSSSYGGEISCERSSNLSITNCTISKTRDGEGIYCKESSPNIKNCILEGNSTLSSGIVCNNSNPTITNCIISGYSGWRGKRGGGIFCYSSSNPIIKNCTISKNTTLSGGGIYCEESNPIIINSILWNNSPQQIYNSENSDPQVTYSNIQNGYTGNGNISDDPLFIDAMAGDFYLDRYSPCIDKGDPNSLIFEDKDGNPRPQDGDGDDLAFCDMGAYEYTEGLYVPNDLSTIQKAIEAASDGDTIVIRPGIYMENINFLGKGITIKSLNPNNTDIVKATIIDGNQVGSVVTFDNEEGPDSVFNGITLQNGKTHQSGGIYCSSSPRIMNCTIINNFAGYSSNDPIWENGGGGIYCTGNSQAHILDCFISSNYAANGAGICCAGNSSPTIHNCTITLNKANNWGGGLGCIDYSSPIVTNCVIVGNLSWRGGGIMCWENTSLLITNCTIIENSADWGEGIECLSPSAIIRNCIFWDNPPDKNAVDPIVTFSEITYSVIQGDYEGLGNIDKDPLFVDPKAGDYHLREDSPCINTGTVDNAPNSDKDGTPRPINEAFDIGAYEFVDCDISSVKMLYKDADRDGYGNLNIVSLVCIASMGYTENAGDCNDNDPNINPGATEICDEKDNDCNGLADEENAEGCTIYYKDNDEDGYGIDDDYRCLCSQDPNAKYTAIQGGDWDDIDPNIPGNYVNADLNLPEGWSMISLPVIPDEPKAAKLFPEAVVVYYYKKGVGYELVKENEELEKGKGYWILFNNDQNLTITGLPIYSYTHTVYEDEWDMIGGCFSKALASGDKCDIGIIYSYVQGMGYQRIHGSGYLEPGNGYWILLKNVTDQANLNVQVIME